MFANTYELYNKLMLLWIEITKYIQDNGDQHLTAAKFVKDNQHVIAKSMTPGQNYKDLWMGYLATVARNNGLELVSIQSLVVNMRVVTVMLSAHETRSEEIESCQSKKKYMYQ